MCACFVNCIARAILTYAHTHVWLTSTKYFYRDQDWMYVLSFSLVYLSTCRAGIFPPASAGPFRETGNVALGTFASGSLLGKIHIEETRNRKKIDSTR